MQTELRQFLPLIAAVSILSAGVSYGQEKFPNELNSPIDEPQVVIQENHQHVPIRPASREITQSKDPLVKLVYETREAQRRRLLSTSDHTPWQIMHGLLGLRQDFLINHNGQPVSGLQWIQTGPSYQNESWFEKTPHGGRAHPFNKPYWFEGHINQFVAILAMCNIPLDTQFGTPQGPITMRDMLKNAQMTTNEQEEVTWTLWALCTYLPSDAEWINAKGEKWSIERLVRLEVGKRVGGPTSPCGGTHGLFALARARNVYLRSGRPLRGVWLEADQKIQKYIETARMQQNQDGTLSSNFFRGREYKQDFDKRMASCGHLLEFLMMALPQERLNEPWIRRAIEGTANDLMANRKAYVSCSPLYHATNALSIYLDRVAPSAVPQQVAQKPGEVKSISSSKDLKAANASLSKPEVPPVPVQLPVTDRPEANSSQPEMPESSPGSDSKPVPAESSEKQNLVDPGTAPMPVEPAPAEPAPAEPAPAEPTPEEPTPAESGDGNAVTIPQAAASPSEQNLLEVSSASEALRPVPIMDESNKLLVESNHDTVLTPEQVSKLTEVIAEAANASQVLTEIFLSARAKTVVVDAQKSDDAPGAEPLIQSSRDSSPKKKDSEDPSPGKLSEWRATLPNRRSRVVR